jgi:hypothetical protein
MQHCSVYFVVSSLVWPNCSEMASKEIPDDSFILVRAFHRIHGHVDLKSNFNDGFIVLWLYSIHVGPGMKSNLGPRLPFPVLKKLPK